MKGISRILCFFVTFIWYACRLINCWMTISFSVLYKSERSTPKKNMAFNTLPSPSMNKLYPRVDFSWPIFQGGRRALNPHVLMCCTLPRTNSPPLKMSQMANKKDRLPIAFEKRAVSLILWGHRSTFSSISCLVQRKTLGCYLPGLALVHTKSIVDVWMRPCWLYKTKCGLELPKVLKRSQKDHDEYKTAIKWRGARSYTSLKKWEAS